MINKTTMSDFTELLDNLQAMNADKYECHLCYDSLFIDAKPCPECGHKLAVKLSQQELNFMAMLESNDWDQFGERVLSYALGQNKIDQELFDLRNEHSSMMLSGKTGSGKTLLARHLFEKERRYKIWIDEDRFFTEYRDGKRDVYKDFEFSKYCLVVIDESGNDNNWNDQNSDRERSAAGHRAWQVMINQIYENRSCRLIMTSNQPSLNFIQDKHNKYKRRLIEILNRGKK
jgi:DNA replication protein DnaC